METINQYLFETLVVLVMVLATIITRHLIPYLKSQVEDTAYAELIDIIAQSVRAVEQTIKESGQGKVKKAEVLAFVSNYLEEAGIYISEAQLDKLIEAAVYVMNQEKKG